MNIHSIDKILPELSCNINYNYVCTRNGNLPCMIIQVPSYTGFPVREMGCSLSSIMWSEEVDTSEISWKRYNYKSLRLYKRGLVQKPEEYSSA
jgi:hypothetical protein